MSTDTPRKHEGDDHTKLARMKDRTDAVAGVEAKMYGQVADAAQKAGDMDTWGAAMAEKLSAEGQLKSSAERAEMERRMGKRER
jgi:hypothetical protein